MWSYFHSLHIMLLSIISMRIVSLVDTHNVQSMLNAGALIVVERPESYVERRTDGFQVEHMNGQAPSTVYRHSYSRSNRSFILTNPSATENSSSEEQNQAHPGNCNGC